MAGAPERFTHNLDGEIIIADGPYGLIRRSIEAVTRIFCGKPYRPRWIHPLRNRPPKCALSQAGGKYLQKPYRVKSSDALRISSM